MVCGNEVCLASFCLVIFKAFSADDIKMYSSIGWSFFLMV